MPRLYAYKYQLIPARNRTEETPALALHRREEVIAEIAQGGFGETKRRLRRLRHMFTYEDRTLGTVFHFRLGRQAVAKLHNEELFATPVEDWPVAEVFMVTHAEFQVLLVEHKPGVSLPHQRVVSSLVAIVNPTARKLGWSFSVKPILEGDEFIDGVRALQDVTQALAILDGPNWGGWDLELHASMDAMNKDTGSDGMMQGPVARGGTTLKLKDSRWLATVWARVKRGVGVLKVWGKSGGRRRLLDSSAVEPVHFVVDRTELPDGTQIPDPGDAVIDFNKAKSELLERRELFTKPIDDVR